MIQLFTKVAETQSVAFTLKREWIKSDWHVAARATNKSIYIVVVCDAIKVDLTTSIFLVIIPTLIWDIRRTSVFLRGHILRVDVAMRVQSAHVPRVCVSIYYSRIR